MSAEDVRLAAEHVRDVANVAVGGAATATVWIANLDVALRIGVSFLTMVYLAVAIWHRLRPRPAVVAPVAEDGDP